VTEVIERHIRACEGFSEIVARAEGRWERPSPCTDWDARSIVEHVIGFHDVLLLRPFNAKPQRPKGDPIARWAITLTAIRSALGGASTDFAPAERGPSTPDLERLLPILTAEALVHTWDLARAVGIDAGLDPGLCKCAYEVVLPNEKQLRESGMFGLPIPVSDDSDAATKLIAFLGRDPSWTAP
jgi:uncharacterized protein (TIGR03086 family)